LTDNACFYRKESTQAEWPLAQSTRQQFKLTKKIGHKHKKALTVTIEKNKKRARAKRNGRKPKARNLNKGEKAKQAGSRRKVRRKAENREA